MLAYVIQGGDSESRQAKRMELLRKTFYGAVSKSAESQDGEKLGIALVVSPGDSGEALGKHMSELDFDDIAGLAGDEELASDVSTYVERVMGERKVVHNAGVITLG